MEERASTWACDCGEMLQALSANLYLDPFLAVRELICNGLDANLRGGGEDVRVRVEDASILEIADEGCGIAPDEVQDVLGTAFFSGTRRAAASGAGEVPIGRFGVGLLSARGVAGRVEIWSWTDAREPGVLWRWSGDNRYTWRTIRACGWRGTRVRLWPLDAVKAELLDEVRLTDFIRRHLTFVRGNVLVGALEIHANDPAPPWRGTERSEQELRTWVEGQGVVGHLHAIAASSARFACGGAVACFPGEHAESYAEVAIYRSGVLVPLLPPGLIRPAFAWIRCVIDAPGLGVTLDRCSVDVHGARDLRAEIDGFLRDAVRRFVRWGAATPEFPRAWWPRHRQSLLASLAAMVREGQAWPADELARWLPFESEKGWLTFHQIVEESQRDRRKIAGILSGAVEESMIEATTVLVVRWASADEREVFLALAGVNHVTLTRPLEVTDPDRRSGRLASIDARVRDLISRIRERLGLFKIEVGISLSGGRCSELAMWTQPPPWAPARGYWPRDVRRDPGPPELHVFADSEVVRALARNLDSLPIGAVAWLLVEWATDHTARDRVVRALYGLLGSQPAIMTANRRCFVAYDWIDHQAEFVAIREALAPLGITAIQASHEAQARSVFDNILRVMQSCHLFITVLTPARVETVGVVMPAPGGVVLNANLLFEAGLAAAFPDRPQILCHPEGFVVPSDLQGRITLRYRDSEDLARQLLVEVRKEL